MIVSSEEGEFSLAKCSDSTDISITSSTSSALISQEAAEILQKAGDGTLGKSTQINVPNVKQDVVVNVDSKAGKVPEDNEEKTLHANVETGVSDVVKNEMLRSDNKEQIVAQVSGDHIDSKHETNASNNTVKDTNFNEIKSDSKMTLDDKQNDIKQTTEQTTDFKLDKTDSTVDDNDKDVKGRLMTGDDDVDRTQTDKSENYGLSKSMVSRLEKMTEEGSYKQGLCQSISCESDVTYHHESEDELLDTNDTGTVDVEVTQSKTEPGANSASFKIGESDDERMSDISSSNRMKEKVTHGFESDQYYGESGILAYKQGLYLNPVESVDDVSSMLVDYDPNETVSLGDYTEDKFDGVESGSSSVEGDDEYRDNLNNMASEHSEKSRFVTLKDGAELAKVFPDFYDRQQFLNATQSYDDVSSMLVECDQSEAASVDGSSEDSFQDAVDNTEMTVRNVERKDYVPGNFSTIDYWVRSVSREEADIGDQSMEDTNEKAVQSDGQTTVSKAERLEIFATGYVRDILENAIKIVHSAPGESNADAIKVKTSDSIENSKSEQETADGKEMKTLPPLDVSTPVKTDTSHDDCVVPFQKPLEESSIDNLSPIKRVKEDTSKEGVEFFSYKLQTQASVVLSSAEDGVNIEEQGEVSSPILPDITGFGVCLSGEGLEEVQKYYKDMAGHSEEEKQLDAADMDKANTSSGANQNAGCSEEIGTDQMSQSEEPTMEADVKKKETVIGEDGKKLGVIDDWLKKGYEEASRHASEESKVDVDIYGGKTEEIGDTKKEGEQQDKAIEIDTFLSLPEASSGKERNISISSESGAVAKRKKEKKVKSSSRERKGSSNDDRKSPTDMRSSTSDLDRRSSGSVQSEDTDLDNARKKGTHGKKKSKEGKDECSVA